MSAENLSPQIINRLLSEIRQLCKSPPEGIEYVEPEDDTSNSISEIYARICGPEGTPYHNGKFVMKLVMSGNLLFSLVL